jgi:hypothetical protein
MMSSHYNSPKLSQLVNEAKCCHAVWSDHRQGVDWILDLLTTYTHTLKLQAITAPPLISTIHKTPSTH